MQEPVAIFLQAETEPSSVGTRNKWKDSKTCSAWDGRCFS